VQQNRKDRFSNTIRQLIVVPPNP